MKQGFDVRDVQYEHIHSIKPEDFRALIDAIDLKPHETILDAMCGYAAVGKGVIERQPKVDLYLLEESEFQLKKAKENLKIIPNEKFILSEFPAHPFPNSFFEKIVIKMGLHEVPKEKQLTIIKEVRNLLKPKGKFVVWDIMLNTNNQNLFQKIIRKKDELSGFDMLTHERYFFREDEFKDMLKEAGFSKVLEFRLISYRFSSKKRLESELQNSVEKLNKLNEYIREIFPESLKNEMHFADIGDNIEFDVVKKIFVIEE